MLWVFPLDGKLRPLFYDHLKASPRPRIPLPGTARTSEGEKRMSEVKQPLKISRRTLIGGTAAAAAAGTFGLANVRAEVEK